LFWRWRSALKDSAGDRDVITQAERVTEGPASFIDLGDLRAGGRVLFVQKVAVSLLRRTSARPKLLIRRAAQRSARLESGTCRGS
jgi:hypothetical protein